LIDCLTCRKEGDKFVFVGTDYVTYKNSKNKGPIIHWLVDDGIIDVDIRMSDNTIISGKAEKYVSEVSTGSVVQFERFGFCRCDSSKDGVFWFTHK